MRNVKKIVRAALLVVLILSMVLDTPLRVLTPQRTAMAAGPGTNLGSIFKAPVKLYKGTGDSKTPLPLDQPIEIEDDMMISLELNWEIDDAVVVNDGDYASITLPDIFKPEMDITGAPLKFSGHPDVGTFDLNKATRVLTLNFNDVLHDKGEFSEGRKGNVIIALQFNMEKFEESVRQEVEFSDSLKISIVGVNPANPGKVIDKKASIAPLNPSEITWTVDVNANMAAVSGAVIKDLIPAGLTLKEETIGVKKLMVGISGGITEGAVLSTGEYSHGYDPDSRELNVSLGDITGAYRITYTTTIDPDKYDETSFANSAEFAGITATATADVTRGKRITKKGKLLSASNTDVTSANPNNAKKVEWTVDINLTKENMQGVTVEDDFSSLPMGTPDIKVYKLNQSGDNWIKGDEVTGLGSLYYSVTKKSSIDLGDIGTQAYRIIYTADIFRNGRLFTKLYHAQYSDPEKNRNDGSCSE